MLCDTKLTRLISYPAKLGWTCRVPEEVRSTGDFAFTGSPLISKVIIPETVTSIGDFAFGRCLDLKNVTIPRNVTLIGKNPFSFCNIRLEVLFEEVNQNLVMVYGILFDRGITRLILYPRQKSGNYTIPNTVVSIDPWAFAHCTNLRSIAIPDVVVYIGENAFHSCNNIRAVTIPRNVTTICKNAFSERLG